MKRTIEIDDTLAERVSAAQDDLKELAVSWLDDNPDADKAPDLFNDLDYSGGVHEIVDSSVPIYTSEIRDTWYLHASELEEAYEDAGIGDNPRDNDGMTAVYCYIEARLVTWYDSEADTIYDEWREARKAKEEAS